MPAKSGRQARTARMAMAVKTGKAKLEDMPEGARDAIRSMMDMSLKDLEEFMHTAKKKGARAMMRGSKHGR